MNVCVCMIVYFTHYYGAPPTNQEYQRAKRIADS